MKDLYNDVDFWRFVAIMSIGLLIGLFVMANTTIDTLIDNTNECRAELYYEANPPRTTNYTLDLQALEGFDDGA